MNSLCGFQTLWFGRIPCKRGFSRSGTSIGPVVLTVWGWLPTTNNVTNRIVIGPRKRPIGPGNGLRGFRTIWFDCGRKPKENKDVAIELVANTVWGKLPIWDGRLAVDFPDGDIPKRCSRFVRPMPW